MEKRAEEIDKKLDRLLWVAISSLGATGFALFLRVLDTAATVKENGFGGGGH